eukprot:TRINITY_DN39742_c1_g1_i2.p1 TRINITY_DN39742_c1_g1~~TRINITY_DN39742_c1_g1_i2.p1  ORF type:complete len:122 (-),score=9.04 TRINITY_DN39742_c1_g1_i2:234-599(-)
MDHIYIPHVTLLKTALLAHLSPRQTGQTSRLLLQFNPVVNTICLEYTVPPPVSGKAGICWFALLKRLGPLLFCTVSLLESINSSVSPICCLLASVSLKPKSRVSTVGHKISPTNPFSSLLC